MIFCSSIAQVNIIGISLSCLTYYAHSPTKHENLHQFLTARHRIIAAINAFDLGLEIPDIRMVIHVDLPRTLLEYAQENCRGGRNGQVCRAIIIQQHRSFSFVDFWFTQYIISGHFSYKRLCENVLYDDAEICHPYFIFILINEDIEPICGVAGIEATNAKKKWVGLANSFTLLFRTAN